MWQEDTITTLFLYILKIPCKKTLGKGEVKKISLDNKTDFTLEGADALKGMGKAYLLILLIGTLALMFTSVFAWVSWLSLVGAFYYFVIRPLNGKWGSENSNEPYSCNCSDNWDDSGNPMNPSSPWFKK